MITIGFIAPLCGAVLPPLTGETVSKPSSLSKELRSFACIAAASGVSCDVSTIPIMAAVTAATATEGVIVATSMACSPPRSHTRITNFPRTLTVPSAALSASKTRRKRSGGGGGGNDDFGGDDGFFGGGDDGFGGGNDGAGGNSEGPFDGDSTGRWLTDVIVLWSIFCAWSTWNVVTHVTQTKETTIPRSSCLAAVSYSAAAAAAIA